MALGAKDRIQIVNCSLLIRFLVYNEIIKPADAAHFFVRDFQASRDLGIRFRTASFEPGPQV